METKNYEKQFVLSVGGLLVICLLISGTFVGLSIKDYHAPLKDLVLDGQTLANYVALTLGTAVALAGSWVAIRIAQAANTAQQSANSAQNLANKLQKDALDLQDPLQIRAREFQTERNALRFNLISMVARASNAINIWHSNANEMAKLLSRKHGLEGIEGCNDPKLPKELRKEAFDLSGKRFEPLFLGITEWLKSEVVEKINTLTPLILMHTSIQEVVDNGGLTKKWVQAVNAITYGQATLHSSDRTNAFANLVQGSRDLTHILDDSRFTDFSYVLKMAADLSGDTSSEIERVKQQLGFDDVIKNWGKH